MKNSRATLVREMRKLLQGLDHVESYIDNLIDYTKDWATYLQVLDKLFRRLQEAHLAVRPTKCWFGSKYVEFLGHLLGGDCIAIKKESRAKICQAKRLTTKKEVRSFLALANCYCNQIPAFAAIDRNAVERSDEERITKACAVA